MQLEAGQGAESKKLSTNLEPGSSHEGMCDGKVGMQPNQIIPGHLRATWEKIKRKVRLGTRKECSYSKSLECLRLSLRSLGH